jgi:hypothetical protein
MRVIILKDGTIKQLVRAVDWHWHFSWRNWRVGVNIQESMWNIDLLWLEVWCDRYYRHGERLEAIPDGVKFINVHPDILISDLQRAGLDVSLVPK